MKRFIFAVVLIGLVANTQAAYRKQGEHQKPQQWTCTWEQSEEVTLHDDGTRKVAKWTKKHAKRSVTAATKEKAIELCKLQANLPSHVQTRNWQVHNVTGK